MKPRVYLPGSKIGVMGGGQLGRMFAIAARRMGYRIHTFAPDEDTPAGQLADREISAEYEDEEAVRSFARSVDVLTFEFENIPLQTIRWAGAIAKSDRAATRSTFPSTVCVRRNFCPVPAYLFLFIIRLQTAASLRRELRKPGCPAS